MNGAERAWFVTRLAEIPSYDGAGALECRRIGYEIHRLHGGDGMVEVFRACRNLLDAQTAAGIARAWIGIGQWQG